MRLNMLFHKCFICFVESSDPVYRGTDGCFELSPLFESSSRSVQSPLGSPLRRLPVGHSVNIRYQW